MNRIVYKQFAYLLLLLALTAASSIETSAQGSLRWVRSDGRIPSSAVVGGEERNGAELYICRTSHNGTTLPGKVVGNQCNYNWGTTEYSSRTFEILTGSGEYWTDDINRRTAVVGGYGDGQSYYVCRASESGGVHPGRMQNGKCNYSFGGRGYASSNYEVLNGNVVGGNAGVVSLLDAAARGDSSEVRAALRAGQAINQKNTKGQTALMLAASKAAVDAVRVLLNEGATVDVRDNEGYTALGYAAFAGDASSVRQLLRAGANLTTRTNNGYTPLYFAAASGDVETVRAILSDPGYERASERAAGFPLHGAAAYDRTEVIAYLIDEEFDVDEVDQNGQTPVMVAARNNKAAATRALIQAEADLTVRTPNNHDVFSLAAVSGSVDVLGVLLNSGKFTVKSPSAESGLRVAARDSKIPVITFLIGRGVDPNARLRDVGITPLMLAAGEGHDNAVKELIKANVDLDLRNNRGETALILAAAAGKKDVVKALLRAGADRSIADNNGKTALDHAVQNKHGDTRKELEKGGN
jgi:ankyrin repeat protein